MRVVPIAQTVFSPFHAESVTDYRVHRPTVDIFSISDPEELDRVMHPVAGIDELAEFAGRNCYQAWERKNPATATNKGYLANIIDHGHFSVLEHGSVTFYIDGISRSLTHELIRHRHLSFSELSQRYVNVEEAQFITPPALLDLLQEENPNVSWEQSNANFREDGAAKEIIKAYQSIYRRVSGYMTLLGVTGRKARKKAREAARAVMPNCTETKIVVTGNLRAWREVIAKRHHEDADEEIKLLAGLILEHLRELAPNSIQDFPEEPFE